MAKKMILVDPSQVIGKSPPIPDVLSDSLTSLDREMKRVLESTNISIHEKAKAFESVLQRYLNRVDQYQNREERGVYNPRDKQSNEKSLLSSEKPFNDKIIKLEKRVVESVPKTLQTKARLLIDHLKDASDLSWNERGEISFNGETIQGSNISDLVNETLRIRKQRNTLTGWKEFVSAMKNSNVPNEFIGDKTKWETSVSEDQSPKLSSSPPITPSSRRRKKRSRKSYNWLSYQE